MEQLIQDHPLVIRALTATFIFQGAYIAMGVYMLLVYLQARKKDYLQYSIYLLLFAGYFFIRVDQVLGTGLILPDEDTAFYFTTPLLFLITGIYIDFINTFAEIGRYSRQFSREVSIFSLTMYVSAVLSVGYLLITGDVGMARSYLGPVFSLVHIYSVYSVIRAFVVIKSPLRYYVLASNVFLISFTALGLNTASAVEFHEGLNSNTMWGFYPVNASQLGIFLEMISFSLGLGYKFNQIELEKDRIQKLDTFKTQLYTNISHEIRTPLTLISGPVENQLARRGLTPDDYRELQLVKANADRLLKLVDQMLDLSVIDSGQRVLRVSRGNMRIILTQLAEAFQYQANTRNIRIDSTVSGLDDVWFDNDVVEKIGANLLSNAVKYAVGDSIIVLGAQRSGGDAVLSVINTAEQIEGTDLNRLFKRFYRENKAVPGVGVGLALVKELAALAKGAVEVREMDEHRICFTVTLPIEKKAFRPDEIIHDDEQDGIAPSENSTSLPGQLATVLVVEDNDEIREFTASLFRADYRTLTAGDGKSGLEQALEVLPDVIIADIMMPEMNGMELCHALKTHIMTSHIPVVMLTARVGEAYELEGYETGANTYLTKPFHPNILKLKIRNLLTDRERFRQRFSESFAITPELAESPTERSFLTKLKSVCETHIADPELTAEKLAGHMSMSRSQLHRKLHAVFGASTTSFIRTWRIRLACELLAGRKVETVAEVAYVVGFSTMSYFNKCFREQMGCTPNEYMEKKADSAPET